MPDFNIEGPQYVYVGVADDIAARIERGELRPGARLLGERHLAEQYGVSIGSIRRAIQILRDRGLVATLPAKGTFVTNRTSKNTSEGDAG